MPTPVGIARTTSSQRLKSGLGAAHWTTISASASISVPPNTFGSTDVPIARNCSVYVLFGPGT